MKKRKRRSVAASRAASLKGWRTRKIMREKRYEGRSLIWAYVNSEKTIDRIPKVEWK